MAKLVVMFIVVSLMMILFLAAPDEVKNTPALSGKIMLPTSACFFLLLILAGFQTYFLCKKTNRYNKIISGKSANVVEYTDIENGKCKTTDTTKLHVRLGVLLVFFTAIMVLLVVFFPTIETKFGLPKKHEQNASLKTSNNVSAELHEILIRMRVSAWSTAFSDPGLKKAIPDHVTTGFSDTMSKNKVNHNNVTTRFIPSMINTRANASTNSSDFEMKKGISDNVTTGFPNGNWILATMCAFPFVLFWALMLFRCLLTLSFKGKKDDAALDDEMFNRGNDDGDDESDGTIFFGDEKLKEGSLKQEFQAGQKTVASV